MSHFYEISSNWFWFTIIKDDNLLKYLAVVTCVSKMIMLYLFLTYKTQNNYFFLTLEK